MNGYQVTFFTQQDRRHRGKNLADWLVCLAADMGLRGATLIPGNEGVGQHHRIHSVHFFELADQPLSVVMAVTADEADKLFDRLRAEKLHLFYVKAPWNSGLLAKKARRRVRKAERAVSSLKPFLLECLLRRWHSSDNRPWG